MKRILIVIPAYNEEENILKTYNSIVDFNRKNGTTYKVIVINDGSTDSTLKILRENDIPHVALIHNLGIGGAVQTGYKYGYENGFDIAVQYDGDGQHDVSYVKAITDPIVNGEADLVVGSRYIDPSESDFQSSFARRCGIKLISWATKLKTGETVLDTTSGFRAVNREIMGYFSKNYPTEFPESITNVECIKMGYRIKEVPVSMNEREGGVSSIRSGKIIYFMLNVVLSILISNVRRKK